MMLFMRSVPNLTVTFLGALPWLMQMEVMWEDNGDTVVQNALESQKVHTYIIMISRHILSYLISIYNLYGASCISVHLLLECGVWIQSNANSDGEVFVGYVNSKAECLAIYHSDPECYEAGASMANIDTTHRYNYATGTYHYGACFCQFGNGMEIDDDDCCITTWAKDCRAMNTSKILF